MPPEGHPLHQADAAGVPQHLPALAADAHPNHRGPYTAAATPVCHLVEFGGEQAAAAALCRLTTLLPIAPELERWLTIPADVHAALEVPREGNRRSWSARCAHSIVDFVLGALSATASSPFELTFYNVAAAEPLDREFIAILQRRIDSERMAITLCNLSPPAHTTHLRSAAELARAYVNGNCTGQDAAEIAAYHALAPHTARNLHRAREALLADAPFIGDRRWCQGLWPMPLAGRTKTNRACSQHPAARAVS